MLVCQFLFAQNAKDSLLTLLKKHPEKDIGRCYILRELRKDAIRNFKPADIYDKEAYTIALKNIPLVKNNYKLLNEYKSFVSDYLYSLGIDYSIKNDLIKAEKFINQALKIDLYLKRYDDIGLDYMVLGSIYEKKGEINTAVQFFFKSINALEKRKGIEEEENNYIVEDYKYLSQIYYNKGNFVKAIQYQFEILKVGASEKSNQNFNKKLNTSDIAQAYNNIGYFYAKEKELKTAFVYFNKAYKLQKSLNKPEEISLIYRNIGLVFLEIKEYKKALKYFVLSTKLTKSKFTFSKNLVSKGIIYLNTNKIDSAHTNFKEALKITRTYKISLIDADIYFNLAEVNFKKKKLLLAQVFAKKSISISKKKYNILETKKCAQLLYKIYKEFNKNAEALKMLEFVTVLNDSIGKDENKNAVLKAEFKYETKKKQSQIQTLSQQKKIATLESQRQKTIVLVLGILMVLLATISYFLFNRYKTQKQTELLKIKLHEAQKTIAAEKQAVESELKALKSQMNPHFIFNALSSIQHQFMYGDKNLANEQMGNFTYLTRQILNVSGLKQILITTEIEILTKYLELEKMRFETNFEYEITLSGNLDPDYHELPPMLLQPLLENSIKHGLMHLQGLKKLSLNFNLNPTEDVLICTIIDNGIGRQKSEGLNLKNLSNHQSYASQALVQRLNIWNKNIDNPLVYSDILDNNGVVCGTQVVLMVEVH